MTRADAKELRYVFRNTPQTKDFLIDTHKLIVHVDDLVLSFLMFSRLSPIFIPLLFWP